MGRVRGGVRHYSISTSTGRGRPLRNWVKAAERGRLNEKAKKVSEEQMELSRLRAENAQLKMENEILKKATAYFAKDRL